MGKASDARRAREASARRVRKRLGSPGVKRASEATIKKVTRSSGGGGSSRVTTVVTGAPASAPERLGETTVTETLATGQTVQVTAQAGVKQSQIERAVTQARAEAGREYRQAMVQKEVAQTRASVFEQEIAQQLRAKGYLTKGEIDALGQRYNLTASEKKQLQKEVGGAQEIPGQYTPVSPLTSTFYQQTQLRPYSPVTQAQRRQVLQEQLVADAPITGTIAVTAQKVAQKAQEIAPIPERSVVPPSLITVPRAKRIVAGAVGYTADTLTGLATFAGAPVQTIKTTGQAVASFGKEFVARPLPTTKAIGARAVQTVRRDPYGVLGAGVAVGVEGYGAGLAFVQSTRTARRLTGLRYRIGAEYVRPEDVFFTPAVRDIEAGRVAQLPKATPAETLAEARRQRTLISASETFPLKTTTIQPGRKAGREDIGIFATPIKTGSPYFLRLTKPQVELAPPTFKAISDIKQEIQRSFRVPRGIIIKDVQAGRFPQEVIQERGFQGPKLTRFLEEQRGTGQVFVTKRSELGQTTETELTIPAGETLIRQPTKKYTVIDRFTVALPEFELQRTRGFGRTADELTSDILPRRRVASVRETRRVRAPVVASPRVRPSVRTAGRVPSLFRPGAPRPTTSARMPTSYRPADIFRPAPEYTTPTTRAPSLFRGGYRLPSGTRAPSTTRFAPIIRLPGTTRAPPKTTFGISADDKPIEFGKFESIELRQPRAYLPTLRATVGGIKAPRKGAKTKRLTGLEERPLLF